MEKPKGKESKPQGQSSRAKGRPNEIDAKLLNQALLATEVKFIYLQQKKDSRYNPTKGDFVNTIKRLIGMEQSKMGGKNWFPTYVQPERS